MARIKRTTLTAEFQKVDGERYARNENNDCTVKAVALLTCVDYSVAHAMMARLGRRPGHGASTWSTESAIKALGFNLKLVDTKSIISRYPGVHSNLSNVTSHHPARFPKAWADGKRYLAFTAGHAFAIINGVCHDWSVNKALRVYRLLEIERAS